MRSGVRAANYWLEPVAGAGRRISNASTRPKLLKRWLMAPLELAESLAKAAAAG